MVCVLIVERPRFIWKRGFDLKFCQYKRKNRRPWLALALEQGFDLKFCQHISKKTYISHFETIHRRRGGNPLRKGTKAQERQKTEKCVFNHSERARTRSRSQGTLIASVGSLRLIVQFAWDGSTLHLWRNITWSIQLPSSVMASVLVHKFGHSTSSSSIIQYKCFLWGIWFTARQPDRLRRAWYVAIDYLERAQMQAERWIRRYVERTDKICRIEK